MKGWIWVPEEKSKTLPEGWKIPAISSYWECASCGWEVSGVNPTQVPVVCLSESTCENANVSLTK